jgi:hypothetical protein
MLQKKFVATEILVFDFELFIGGCSLYYPLQKSWEFETLSASFLLLETLGAILALLLSVFLLPGFSK